MHPETTNSPHITEYTRHGPDGAHVTVERIGCNPTIFFVSGIHGDEHEVIEPLRNLLNEKAVTQPACFGSHARVLIAHPSAVETASRTVNGIDLNRQFPMKVDPDYPQAKLLTESFLEHKHVHTLFSFHEDPLEDRFYFYYQATKDDAGNMDLVIKDLRDALISQVESLGIPLYDGVDDIDLGYWVDRGFCAVAADSVHDNTFESWVVQKEIHGHPAIQREFLFEIPGTLPIEKKEQLTRVILDHFVGPYTQIQNGVSCKSA